MGNFFVYIAQCQDGKLYIGKTTNLKNRIIIHNNGQGAQFIRQHGPAKIVHFEKFDNNLNVCKRERQIKKWSRIKKENLIKFGHPNPNKLTKKTNQKILQF